VVFLHKRHPLTDDSARSQKQSRGRSLDAEVDLSLPLQDDAHEGRDAVFGSDLKKGQQVGESDGEDLGVVSRRTTPRGRRPTLIVLEASAAVCAQVRRSCESGLSAGPMRHLQTHHGYNEQPVQLKARLYKRQYRPRVLSGGSTSLNCRQYCTARQVTTPHPRQLSMAPARKGTMTAGQLKYWQTLGKRLRAARPASTSVLLKSPPPRLKLMAASVPSGSALHHSYYGLRVRCESPVPRSETRSKREADASGSAAILKSRRASRSSTSVAEIAGGKIKHTRRAALSQRDDTFSGQG
jgi:hypothetical protein